MANRDGGDDAGTHERIDRVIADHAEDLMRVPGVVGVGAGDVDGSPVIEVLVDEQPEGIRARLPSDLDGFSLHVVRTGTIEALDRD